LINKEIDANLITDNPDFKSLPEDGTGTIDSKNNRNRFMYYSNTELISRQKAIQLLNDTSNN